MHCVFSKSPSPVWILQTLQTRWQCPSLPRSADTKGNSWVQRWKSQTWSFWKKTVDDDLDWQWELLVNIFKACVFFFFLVHFVIMMLCDFLKITVGHPFRELVRFMSEFLHCIDNEMFYEFCIYLNTSAHCIFIFWYKMQPSFFFFLVLCLPWSRSTKVKVYCCFYGVLLFYWKP